MYYLLLLRTIRCMSLFVTVDLWLSLGFWDLFCNFWVCICDWFYFCHCCCNKQLTTATIVNNLSRHSKKYTYEPSIYFDEALWQIQDSRRRTFLSSIHLLSSPFLHSIPLSTFTSAFLFHLSLPHPLDPFPRHSTHHYPFLHYNGKPKYSPGICIILCLAISKLQCICSESIFMQTTVNN